jgi:hypothetical protein
VAIVGPAIARGKPLRSGGVTLALASAGIVPFQPRRGRLKVFSVSVHMSVTPQLELQGPITRTAIVPPEAASELV